MPSSRAAWRQWRELWIAYVHSLSLRASVFACCRTSPAYAHISAWPPPYRSVPAPQAPPAPALVRPWRLSRPTPTPSPMISTTPAPSAQRTMITPPPFFFSSRKSSLSPSILADQSMVTCSSSVHAGEHIHYSQLTAAQSFLGRRSLKPGLLTLAAYSSAIMLSNVEIAGKYAKNCPCCQCVIPSLSSGRSASDAKLTGQDLVLEVPCDGAKILT